MQPDINLDSNIFYPTKDILKKEIDSIDEEYLEILYKIISAFRPITTHVPNRETLETIRDIETGNNYEDITLEELRRA